MIRIIILIEIKDKDMTHNEPPDIASQYKIRIYFSGICTEIGRVVIMVK